MATLAIRHEKSSESQTPAHIMSIELSNVTKTYPAADVATLAELGVLDIGESRDQEARAKVAALHEAGVRTIRWHIVGRLQTNKARSVASYAHAVHSVDEQGDQIVEFCFERVKVRAERVASLLVQIPLDAGSGCPPVRGITNSFAPPSGLADDGHR